MTTNLAALDTFVIWNPTSWSEETIVGRDFGRLLRHRWTTFRGRIDQDAEGHMLTDTCDRDVNVEARRDRS